VALRRSGGQGARFAFVVPSPYRGPEAWVAIVLDLLPAPSPGEPGASRHETATLAILGKLVAERAEVAGVHARAEPLPAAPAPAAVALEPYERDLVRWPRRGLGRLAERIGAVLALDAALTCRASALEDVVVAVTTALRRRRTRAATGAYMGGAAGPALEQLRTLSWDVDLATLGALLRAPNRAGARSLLERRFGAAFEDDLAGTGKGLLTRAPLFPSHRELEAAVLERNLLALEDTRPRTRLVASRWLATIDPGVEGYDPLGPFEERRHAVDRLWQRLAPEESP
jgi:hypothetical protein